MAEILNRTGSSIKNGDTIIGLFQKIFEKNILTFNPGRHSDAKKLDSFTDVCDLQKELKEREIEFDTEANEEESGPDSFLIVDSDGNPMLVSQYV
ncbi:MAG: hypothetical protein U5K72_10010 [Balneolaceae bacterium]|nr:hypothetical protein [Balneolaceae bacterium]